MMAPTWDDAIWRFVTCVTVCCSALGAGSARLAHAWDGSIVKSRNRSVPNATSHLTAGWAPRGSLKVAMLCWPSLGTCEANMPFVSGFAFSLHHLSYNSHSAARCEGD